MFLDFVLMKKLAAFADRRPSLKWMNLGPSMEQFSNTMSAQVHVGVGRAAPFLPESLPWRSGLSLGPLTRVAINRRHVFFE